MRCRPLLLLLTLFCSFPSLLYANPQVKIDTGTVKATVNGVNFPGAGWVFAGIRYAQPPLGTLRFQNAVRKDPSGVIEATNFGNQCVQGSEGHEDCLVLNVFTPANVTANARLPVLFYIHGGGFIGGNGNMPEGILTNLVSRGPIVMVSINYRLGALGFYTTRDDVVPGNAGISDQIEALHWVQRYISFFGGDPQRVTIDGQSAGSMSVSALTMTQSTRGLFHQAILQSGSAYSTGVWSYTMSNRNFSMQVAVAINCTTKADWLAGGTQAAVDCLQTKTALQIEEADWPFEMEGSAVNEFFKWGPVQDPVIFPDRLEVAAANRPPMKMMAGVCSNEWIVEFYDFFQNNQVENFTEAYGVSLMNGSGAMAEGWDNPQKVIAAALQQYFYGVSAGPTDYMAWANQTITSWSDMLIIGATLRDAALMAHYGGQNYIDCMRYGTDVPHGWDIPYIWGAAGAGGFTPTAQDLQLQDAFGQIWVNFVITGDPLAVKKGILSTIPAWPLLGAKYEYLSITPTPRAGNGFHPSSLFFACTAPTLDGHKPPFCA